MSARGPVDRLRRFLTELKRRRMFRALGAYGIVVFAVLQVAETIVHGLHLPDWTVSAVVMASAAGFPVVVLMAWFYDLTARGIERTPEASPPAAAGRPDTPVAPIAPGAMTALLEELARAPDSVHAPPPLRPGGLLGRYEIVREIGRGGFGVVCEARDRELGRLVAVKTIHPGPGVDAGMLRVEAEAAAQLQHPNIVTIHDVGTTGGEAWLVYELLHGETLEDRLRRGSLPLPEALRVAEAVAAGMAHAHRAGVIHRDLKPANVFLCQDGGVKILDFGLSRFLGSGGREGGTPGYMAPEQWRGEAQDARADVFAAGVMLFETLSGARPYPVETGRSAVLDARRPPPLRTRGVPARLRRVVARSIDPDRERRPQDGASWLEALRQTRRSGERARVLRLAAAPALALGLGALLLLLWRARAPDDGEAGPRIPVAVADVANVTSDPELSGLSGMLVTSLEQSRRLTVLTRSRLVDAIRQLGHEPPAVLDEPLAREVGRTLGVRALLLATVHRFDDLYAIELRALDPVKNEYLFTLAEQGRGKASVPGLIDRLSRRTRDRLSERDRDIEGTGRPVAALTTASLSAYEHFFKARQAVDLRQFDKAHEELKAALQDDPGFALAQYEVTVLDAWTHVLGPTGFDAPESSEQKANLEAALGQADRLPDKERLSLLAWKATVDQRTEEATRLRDQVAEAFPQDKDAVFWSADVRFHAGDPAGAIPGFEKALELDPDYQLAMEHLVQALAMAGRPVDELAWARRWSEAARSAESRRALARALLLNGRPQEAEQAFRAVWSGLPWPPPALASWMARNGRVEEAETLLRQALSAAPTATPPRPTQEQTFALKLRQAQWEQLSGVLALQGRWRDAERALRDGQRGRPAEEQAMRRLGFSLGTRSLEETRRAIADLAPPVLARSAPMGAQAALALAVAGDLQAAEPLLARARLLPGWALVPAPTRELIDGVMAWRAGRDEEATAHLRAAMDQPLAEVRYQSLAVQAELAWSRQRAAAAVAAAERAMAEPWSSGGSWYWLHPRVLLVGAAAAERLGDRARARRHLDAFLTLWRRADPDLPLLAEARALERRLGAAP
jgi:eukaryotic-like serine/threonine-protein kinase